MKNEGGASVKVLAGCVVGIALVAGCGDSGADGAGGSGGGACEVDTTYAPEIDPANFVAGVDNPLYPLVPGTTLTYAEGTGTVTIVVMSETREVMGVTCVVVHDVLTDGGEIVEDTFDWYAQDVDGAVWYFGEDTKEYEGGMVSSTEGSWEAGVDGALPGIIVPAMPALGAGPYRQEYYACHAEDMGEVIGLDESVTVPYGSFTGCMKTRDTTPLEPDVEENKYYCPGVGVVLSVDVASGAREELTAVTAP